MSSRLLHIVTVSSEVYPFAKTGGLADVAGALPLALARLGHKNTIITPAYQKTINGRFALSGTGLTLAVNMSPDLNESIEVLVSEYLPGVTSYFLSHPLFSQRPGLYGTINGDYGDNAYRFALFCRGALELIKALDLKPDIMHCHDWQTGLVPPLVNKAKADPHFIKNRTVFTIHNLAYQGVFGLDQYLYTGLPERYYCIDGLEFYGQVNYLKGGIFFADRLTTVSPSYAKEILTPEQGWNLDGALRSRQTALTGILNGLDYSEWGPASDKLLPTNYSPDRLRPKDNLKRILCKRMGIVYDQNRPLLAIVSRLAKQKGLDLLLEAFDDLIEMGCDLVLLGTGEGIYHDAFAEKKRQYPNGFGLKLGYDEGLSHLIYAGSDMFLMPSLYEPCGLGQMIALRYGSIPVVRKTGGLADTITDYDEGIEKSNGFIFVEFTSRALRQATSRAVKLYKDKASWNKLVARAMNCDFSWDASARKYHDLYQSLSNQNL